MPEGDTVHKLAAYLAPRLVGRELCGGRLRDAPGLELAGRRVERVAARGKHLFVELSGERSVRSHLGMHGSWHRYAPGEAWKLSQRRAALTLETERDVLVCFDAAEVEWLRSGGLAERDLLARLGPDLAAEEVDLDEVLRRARAAARDRPIADLLLDQRVASGIGNVYKSEVLFLERVEPCTDAAEVDDAMLTRLYARARACLRANLHGGPRATRSAADGRGGLWVYRRGGRPCLRCGTAIRRAPLGADRRSTYWCPACQARRA